MKIIDHVPASKLLIPVNLDNLEEISDSLIEVTKSLQIVLLGYWPVPEQSSPEQVQKEHGEEARQRLAKLRRRFEIADDHFTKRVVFTPRVAQTIDDISDEEGCDAILTLRPIEKLERIVVVLREDISFDRIGDFVIALIQGHSAHLSLIFYADEEDHEEKELVLRGFKEKIESSLAEATIESESVEAKKISDHLLKASDEYDLIIMARTSPALVKKLVAPTDQKVSRRASTPVIVVRHDDE